MKTRLCPRLVYFVLLFSILLFSVLFTSYIEAQGKSRTRLIVRVPRVDNQKSIDVITNAIAEFSIGNNKLIRPGSGKSAPIKLLFQSSESIATDSVVKSGIKKKVLRQALVESVRSYAIDFQDEKDASKALNKLNLLPEVESVSLDAVVQIRSLSNDQFIDPDGNGGWAHTLYPVDEDINRNGVLDFGEDSNNNGVLDFSADTWGLQAIKTDKLWEINQGTGVVIAVLDTGIYLNHPDLINNIKQNGNEISGNNLDDDRNGYVDDINGWDFTTCPRIDGNGNCPSPKLPDNDPNDSMGHGTHVAGIIAAELNNTIGIAGVAPQSKLMILRALDEQGYGYASEIAEAIVYATDNGADIINNSWTCPDTGCFGDTLAITAALNYADLAGTLSVFAAGNLGNDIVTRNVFPVNLQAPKPLVVGALNRNLLPDSYTNRSFTGLIDVAAPGTDILSTRCPLISEGGTCIRELGARVGTDYLRISGTSMAAPYVSGLAAAIISQHRQSSNFVKDFTPDEVRRIIRDSSDPSILNYYAGGKIDAIKAMSFTTVPARINAFTSPTEGQTYAVGQRIPFIGTVDQFEVGSYELSYSPAVLPRQWTPFYQSNTPVTSNELGSLDTTSFQPGVYQIRLVFRMPSNSTLERTVRIVLVPSIQLGTKVSSTSDPQFSPAIYYGKVAWINGGNNPGVFVKNILDSTSTPRRLSDSVGSWASPAIFENYVAWKDTRLSPLGGIYLYDTNNQLAAPVQLGSFGSPGLIESILNQKVGFFPALSKGHLVWSEALAGGVDLHYLNTSIPGSTPRRLSEPPGKNFYSALYGDQLNWYNGSTNQGSILTYYTYNMRSASWAPRVVQGAPQQLNMDLRSGNLFWYDASSKQIKSGATTSEGVFTTNSIERDSIDNVLNVAGSVSYVVYIKTQEGNVNFLYARNRATGQEKLVDVFVNHFALNVNQLVWARPVNGVSTAYFLDLRTLLGGNLAPQLSTDPLGPFTLREREPLSIKLSGADPEGDRLQYAIRSLPEGAIFDTANGRFSWTPASWQSGTYEVVFRARDFTPVGVTARIVEQPVLITVRNDLLGITGKVVYSDNLPASNILLKLFNSSGAEMQQALTNSTGRFEFFGVSPGTYKIIPKLGATFIASPSNLAVSVISTDLTNNNFILNRAFVSTPTPNPD